MKPNEQADELYSAAVAEFGPALDRLTRAYEAEADARGDLLQEIHIQLWRSFRQFDGRCSVRTWVYRVAHNVAIRHVMRQRRVQKNLVSLEEAGDAGAFEPDLSRASALERLSALIQHLKPLDRQIIVLYLEGVDAATTGEVTGLSPANVAMKIHRIKNILKRWFEEGGSRDAG